MSHDSQGHSRGVSVCNRRCRLVPVTLLGLLLVSPIVIGQEKRAKPDASETALANKIEVVLDRAMLKNKTRVAAAELVRIGDREVWVTRIHFLKKEGYNSGSVISILERILRVEPHAYFPRFDLGFTENLAHYPGPAEHRAFTWRLRLLEVAISNRHPKKPKAE